MFLIESGQVKIEMGQYKLSMKHQSALMSLDVVGESLFAKKSFKNVL